MKKIGSLVFRYWWYYLFLGVWFFLLGLAPPAPVYGFDYADASLSEFVVNWGTGEQSLLLVHKLCTVWFPNAAQVTIKLVPVQEYIGVRYFDWKALRRTGMPG